jgi:PelA/Pel-15E family pectate lyase
MKLPRPSPSVVASIHAGAAWFKKNAIYGVAWRSSPNGRQLVKEAGGGPLWARYYEMGTDRPIFGDRDKTIHDDVNELSKERRNGYQWYGAKPREALNAYELWARSHPLT